MLRLARLALGGVFVISACASETIVHRLNEKEANSIIVLLAQNDIKGSKIVLDTGRTVFYHISVPAGDKLQSLEILQNHDYPRRVIHGYAEVFSESGLIPTSSEESAKSLRAIEGEIERQIRLVPGVLDVEVNIVIPAESALRTQEDAQSPPKASVVVKFLGGVNNIKPVTMPGVQALVASSVEKLEPDHVTVKLVQADASTEPVVANAGDGTVCPVCPTIQQAVGVGFLGKLSAKKQKMWAVGIAALILILALAAAFGQLRAKNARARLMKLQSEIAKAQRRGQDSLAAPEE